MNIKIINTIILAVMVLGSLYIAYSFEQDYKYKAFMNCLENKSDVTICNVINFKHKSVYAPN